MWTQDMWKSVLVTLEDGELRYREYLPKRYAGVFTDEELRHISPSDLHLVIRGMRNQTVHMEIVPR